MGNARHYPRFQLIDGSHPIKEAAPDACVEYAARRRHDGQIRYFNFGLAKEIGLIPRDHPERLNEALRKAILDTFCLVIINEYDIEHNRQFPKEDILPNTYMATRYLQVQHPSRVGRTSGDGRSVWNGCITYRGITWDVSSCGTGVTRLCPATAKENEYFKTGNDHADYGCGTASIDEGLAAALTSETFYRNGIRTERVLALIETRFGQSINVRVAKNLLRPSHFMAQAKQGNYETLKALVDHFIERQVHNGEWPCAEDSDARYHTFAKELARTFGEIAAVFESEYIFCWLDWDGDNIFADGGIVDYGSVRQFGLYHKEYRFDDRPRWSTTIPEQKRKARMIVQNIAQIRDYLCTGRKSPLHSYRRDRILKLFDEVFERKSKELLLHKLGLPNAVLGKLIDADKQLIARFQNPYRYFERARSKKGPIRVPDGISWNAIFCMRDVLRELPTKLRDTGKGFGPRAFLELAASKYAKREDLSLTRYRQRMLRGFQREYVALLRAAAAHMDWSFEHLLEQVCQRSTIINRADRITGNGALYASMRLFEARRRLLAEELSDVVNRFVDQQDLTPPEDRPQRAHSRCSIRTRTRRRPLAPLMRRLLHEITECIALHRHSL